MGSGSVVLFNESLGLNVLKFKKDFVVKGGRGVAKYNFDLRGYKNI